MNIATRKLLPHNQEAERSVLGSILSDGKAVYTAMTLLSASDFSLTRHAEIFDAMKRLSTKETEIDVLSVADTLRQEGKFEEVGGIDFLSELEEAVPTGQAVTHHSRIVAEKSATRRLIKKLQRVTQEAWDESEDVETLIETAQNELYEIALALQNKNRGKQVYGPQEIAKIAAEMAGEWMENPDRARGIETGFVQLDRSLRGLKDVNIISASTGIGKTAFALNLAVNVGIHNGIPTLYLNHEMNLSELIIRLQGILSGVPTSVIMSGRYSEFHPFQQVMAASEKMCGGKLHLTDNQPKTINGVISLIQKYKAQHDIKVVILDYLGEIEPTKEELRESEYLIYGQWVQRLKSVCVSLGIKLVLLAQLNREGDREVSKNKIGGSWKIAQKADTFLILGVGDKGRHYLKIDKNRNGPAPKTIDLNFDKETQRICEAG